MSSHEMTGRIRAFVYIDVKPGKERAIVDQLMKYDEVIEAHVITGQYDVLAVLEFSKEVYGFRSLTTPQRIVQEFIERIRKLRDVRDTDTVLPMSSVTKRE